MDINVKIEDIKNRVMMLTKHFPYSEFEINIITICYMAIASIDNDITDIIDELLSREFILFNRGEFNEVLNYLEAPLDAGGFHRVVDFNEYKKGKYEFLGINVYRAYLFGMFDIINIRLLIEYVLHEMKHAMNTIVNSYKRDGSNTKLRVGLSEYDLAEKESRGMWEEVFNDFLTKIYLRQVQVLKSMDIKDPGIKSILDSFNLEDDLVYAYFSTSLVSSLFNDIDNFRVFYNAALYKDYEQFFKIIQELFSYDMEGNKLSKEEVMNYLDGLLADYQDSFDSNISYYFAQKISGPHGESLGLKPYFEHI